jgi:hypothetical protein
MAMILPGKDPTSFPKVGKEGGQKRYFLPFLPKFSGRKLGRKFNRDII